MKISRIETLQLNGFPNLLWVRIYTDAGIIGCGETYYTPEATATYIHEIAAKLLLGQDPRQIEKLWWRQYEMSHISGNNGLEMRTISAIDIALWDISARASNLPVHQMLGGAVRDRIRIYNTCAGPRYATATPGEAGYSHHHTAKAGQMEDLHAFLNEPARLARDLLDHGITAMKIWPFDAAGDRTGGCLAGASDIEPGLSIVRKIRESVGDAIEILIEGHCMWTLPAAVHIAEALASYKILWLEDMLRADEPANLRRLRDATNIPITGSERLQTRWAYKKLLDAEAVDIVMTDPIWTGGVSESIKIANLASSYDLPIVFHDCTGPIGLTVALQLAAVAPNVPIQESVRAYYLGHYRELVTESVKVDSGHVAIPDGIGIGTTLREELFTRPDAIRRISSSN